MVVFIFIALECGFLLNDVFLFLNSTSRDNITNWKINNSCNLVVLRQPEEQVNNKIHLAQSAAYYRPPEFFNASLLLSPPNKESVRLI